MVIAKIEIELANREPNKAEIDGFYYFPIQAAKASKDQTKIGYYVDLADFEYYNNGNPEDTLVLAEAVLIVTSDSVVLKGWTVDADGNSWWQDDHLIVKSFEIVDKFPHPTMLNKNQTQTN